jgi:hypothetical protein
MYISLFLFTVWVNKPFASFDIYKFGNFKQVAVTENLIAVTDIEEHRILVHSAENGAFLYSFGFKGEGPGAFLEPYAIWDRGDRFLIEDRLFFSYFNYDGTFQEKLRKPSGFFSTIFKGRKGFVTESENMWSGDSELKIQGHHGSSTRNIIILPIDAPNRREDANKGIFRINPTQGLVNLLGSDDGQWAYYCQADGFQIYKISTSTYEVVDTLNEDLQPVPLDRNWADAYFHNMVEKMEASSESFPLTPVKDFPDVWPVVRLWDLASDGLIYVFLNTGKGKADKILSYDLDLVKQPPLFASHEALNRTVHVGEKHVLFLTYVDDQLGLVKGDKDDLEKLVAEYPIDYDSLYSNR